MPQKISLLPGCSQRIKFVRIVEELSFDGFRGRTFPETVASDRMDDPADDLIGEIILFQQDGTLLCAEFGMTAGAPGGILFRTCDVVKKRTQADDIGIGIRGVREQKFGVMHHAQGVIEIMTAVAGGKFCFYGGGERFKIAGAAQFYSGNCGKIIHLNTGVVIVR